MSAGKSRGAEETAPETRALFVGPIDKADGNGGLAVVLLGNPAQDGVCADNSETAVEPTAVGHGVEMAAENECCV